MGKRTRVCPDPSRRRCDGSNLALALRPGSCILRGMIVFAREVYACRCGTDVPEEDPEASDVARRAVLSPGTAACLAELDPEHHDAAHLAELRARLDAGEDWT